MPQYDEKDRSEMLLEEREKNGVKVEVLSTVMLDREGGYKSKDMPPGAVIMITQEEYEKLSKPQREKPMVDLDSPEGKKFKRDIMDKYAHDPERAGKILASMKDDIDFMKAQPGGKGKLKALIAKSGPAVKKTNRTLSTPAQIKEYRAKRQAGFAEETQAAIEQVKGH